jgi:signal transduction histidine kinase
MKSKIIIIVFLITGCFLTAQQQESNDSLRVIKLNDSLRDIIHLQKGDTAEVNALFKLSLYPTPFDSGAKFARQGLALAQKIKYKKGEADCLFSLGNGYAHAEKQSEAVNYCFNALRIYTDIDDFQGMASAHMLLYGCYIGIGDINNAALHVNEGLKIVETYKVKGLKFDSNEKESQVIHFYLAELGWIYLQDNQLDSALFYTQKAIDQNYKIDGSVWNYPIYLLGGIERQKGNYEHALAIYRWAIHLAKQNHQFHDTLQIFSGISTLYKMLGNPDSSIYYGQKVVQSTGFRQPENYFEAVKNLAYVYKLKGNKDSALKYIEIFHALNDSNNNIRKNREILNNAFNEKMKQQELISAQVKYKSKLQLYAVIGGLLIMLFIAGMLWYNNQQRKKAYALLQGQKEETEIQKKRVEEALEELKTTQVQLVHAEKMASLGELTAGIAHEIQNPLNFVNNFSDVNAELIDEAERALNQDKEETRQLLGTIKENEEKIRLHGQRADAIVKSMLQHSRTSSGQVEPTDINALADEYLRLAYHGLRAKEKSFNTLLKTDFDPAIEKVNIISQDIGRVLLNLYNNAFYAVMEKKKMQVDSFEPTVSVSTLKKGNKLLISVKDNGNGIPKNVLNKIFQPFFTTKPTGHGTGLGLSLSYDIIKANGGEIRVETVEGEYTIFYIDIPA